MGYSRLFSGQYKMKFLLLTCLVAAVKAEADADAFLYAGSFGYAGYPFGYSYGVPFGSSTGLDPITQGLDPVTQGALPAVHYIGKRSADADAFLYTNAYGVPFGSSTGLHPPTQGLDPVTQGAALPAYHYIGKRSADAEPKADADALLYTGTYVPHAVTYPFVRFGFPASYSYGALPYAYLG